MRIETAEKAKKILERIDMLEDFIDVYSKPNTSKTCHEYIMLAITNCAGSNVAQIDFDELDDDFLEAAIIKAVVEEKKRIEKELEELC